MYFEPVVLLWLSLVVILLMTLSYSIGYHNGELVNKYFNWKV